MSVANDALKNVHEIQEEKSPVSVSHLQFHPADPATPEKPPASRLTLPSLMYAFVLFTFLILGVLLLRAINHRIQARAVAAPTQTGVVSGSDVTRLTPPKNPESTPAPATARTQPPTATTSPLPATLAAQSAPAKPAPYKLQAVFYSPARPLAIIGGKTVLIGDQVGLYRVKSISPTSVTLESGDQTKVLTLQ